MKLHKRYEGTELVPCRGKTEVFSIKPNTNVSGGAGESGIENMKRTIGGSDREGTSFTRSAGGQ